MEDLNFPISKFSTGGSDGKRIGLQCGRSGFDPWVGKISWRREWQPTPVFLPGESHGQRSLLGYISSTRSQRVRHDCVTDTYTHTQQCGIRIDI